ncbi:hypothetical protein EBU71_00985 [bacterium]|jgi:hypothetical protein|nr:hypothetical protein [Candidatus Elulimicrobium humile]
MDPFDDETLGQISSDIDTELLKWMTTYEIHPLNLIAIILARLTWIAKQSEITEDFLKLLESPKNVIHKTEQEKKQIH